MQNHDLLRDLSLREAKKQRFLCMMTPRSPDIFFVNTLHRIVIHLDDLSPRELPKEVLHVLQSSSFLRSSVSNFVMNQAPSLDFRLLRTVITHSGCSLEDVFQLLSSRYINFPIRWEFRKKLPSFMCLVWNMQTLIIKGGLLGMIAPSEIWKMLLLRHLMVDGLSLPDPHSGVMDEQEDEVVLENLQTLSFIENFSCTEVVVRRIPNIKKLRMWYSTKVDIGLSPYCLSNLSQLHKLESLGSGHPYYSVWPPPTDLLEHLSFPLSLTKLSLCHCHFNNEDITTRIGSLPNLEKLKLLECLIGEEWNPVEGQFLRLKFLEIEHTYLKRWTAEGTHFPCLQHIVLANIPELEEIPAGIGDIETLRSIRLKRCSYSIIVSANKILEEQRSLGNEDLCLVTKHPKDFDKDEENG